MPAQSLLIVGSGPGIALHTALHFATQGFTHIALISRTQSNLDATKSTLTTTHPNLIISTHAADVSDTTALTSALRAVETSLGAAPGVILFNAAHVAPSTLGSDPASRLLTDFATTTAALYTVATTFLPRSAALLVTGGHIHHMPFPPYFSLSVSKAAQFNLAGSLAQVYGPQGVHVATVVINGIVEGVDGEMGARNIAGEVWRVYQKGAVQGKEGEMSVSEVGTVEGFLRKIGVLK